MPFMILKMEESHFTEKKCHFMYLHDYQSSGKSFARSMKTHQFGEAEKSSKKHSIKLAKTVKTNQN